MRYYILIIIIALLASCDTNNSRESSKGRRVRDKPKINESEVVEEVPDTQVISPSPTALKDNEDVVIEQSTDQYNTIVATDEGMSENIIDEFVEIQGVKYYSALTITQNLSKSIYDKHVADFLYVEAFNRLVVGEWWSEYSNRSKTDKHTLDVSAAREATEQLYSWPAQIWVVYCEKISHNMSLQQANVGKMISKDFIVVKEVDHTNKQIVYKIKQRKK